MTSPLYPSAADPSPLPQPGGQFSLGAIALQSAVAQAVRPGRRHRRDPAPVVTATALRAQGQAGDLPAHVGRTAAPRLFDYKPELVKRDGQDCAGRLHQGQALRLHRRHAPLMGTPRTFAQHGSGGLWMSDAVPNFQSGGRRIVRDPVDDTPTSSTTRRRSCCSSPVPRARDGPRWARGSPTASGPPTRICPGSSC
jgi:hypothetical protein